MLNIQSLSYFCRRLPIGGNGNAIPSFCKRKAFLPYVMGCMVENLARVEMLPVYAYLEMQVLGAGMSRAPCKGYHLSCLHAVANLYKIL